MFEKLAGNVLSKVLSKYFTDESLSKNQVYKKSQLGVWSGYITLNDLEVKTDVINKKLRQKGQPFELVHCSLKQVEITIPWAKLSNPISGSMRSTNRGSNNNGNGSGASAGNQDAVVVLVMDGVHALFRTTFEFHDEELRDEEIKERRKALSVSENYARSTSSNVEEYYDRLDEAVGGRKSYTDLLKQRISSGLLQEVARQVHVHIRDMHIRIEDKESDPESPFAFGVTMESMHLQQDDEQDDNEPQSNSPEGVVSKVAQMNHFAAYWNALEYGHGLPPENSLLHETCAIDKEKLSRALDNCIARRAGAMPSLSKRTRIPKHTYVLLPVDGYLHALLSTTPNDLTTRPAIDIAIQLDVVSTNLRDFQCVQMLKLYGERENFMFVKKFRKFRPRDSVMENASVWWEYATRVIRHELRSSMLRWSWTRFQKSYALRARYMALYERRIRHGSQNQPTDDATRIAGEAYGRGLTEEERKEIQDLEDGLVGELSTSDIILYRALTNVRLGNASLAKNGNISTTQVSSWWKQTVVDAASGDTEARDELDRLLNYLDKIPDHKLVPESRNDSLSAISLVIQLEEVNFAMFSPLHITSEETQLKRLHEKFLELNTKVTRIGGSMKGDYKRFDFEFSVVDFSASEIRLDKTHHVVANQLRRDLISTRGEDAKSEDDEKAPLFLFAYSKKPVHNPEVDKEARMFLNPIEVVLNPECQWIAHGRQFAKELATVSEVKRFWRELSLARLNSLALGNLGLVAKAESAVSNHENIDVDFNLNCPVLRIGMGDDGDLICDTGFLSIKTDQLAGISRNTFRTISQLQQGGSRGVDALEAEQWQNGIDDSSAGEVISVRTKSSRRRPPRRYFFSSAMSVDSVPLTERGNHSLSGSFNLDDTLVQLEPNDHGKSGQSNPELQDLFYDRYQICLKTGKITFSGESEIFDVCAGFEIRTVLQKSVIPTDHTLCKLKVHTILGGVKILLNENIVSRFGSGVNMWKALLVIDVASGTFHAKRSVPVSSVDRDGDFFQSLSRPSEEDARSEDGSSSAVNEDEFFDANEGAESVAGENSGVWFEDNWIADAESVIDGESRSSFSGRRGRRRQPSVSDMSSVSDQSAGRMRRGHLDNGYLSAENLARLEEGGDDEDDSAGDSRKDKDEDSFHSTMSAEGQEKLLKDVAVDIAQTEENILKLSESLKEGSGEHYSIDDVRNHEYRRRRKETKLQLDRSKAELRAMQVLLSDLKSLLSENPKAVSSEKSDDASIAAIRNQQARNVRALLRAKKRRDAIGQDTGHSLVRNLNRAIFKGSVLLNNIQIAFRFEQRTGMAEDETSLVHVNFDVVANQLGLALFHHVNETKLYFSLDQITAKIQNYQHPFDVPSDVVFSGGTIDTLLPAHLPHLIAHSMEDRFLRGAINIGKHRLSESSDRMATVYKVRLVVGDIEISPYDSCLRPFFECVSRLKGTMLLSKAPVNKTPLEISTSRQPRLKWPKKYDLAFRLASLRFAICRQDSVAGAVALTESSVRFIQISSSVQERAQLDVRSTNAQLLDVLNLEAGRGLELLGRRDPYSSLLQVRVRSHLVPNEERGGWVVGEDSKAAKTRDSASRSLVRNVHIGLRINPLAAVVSPDATYKLLESLQEMKRTIHHLKQPQDDETDEKKEHVGWNLEVPTRWRADMTFRRVNIKFSRESKDEWDMTDDLGAKMFVALTVVISMQESPLAKNALSMRMGLTDISLIRSSDDWPIFEPFSVINELVVPHMMLVRLNCGTDLSPLQMRSDSVLSEIEAVMARHGWDTMPPRKTDDISTKLALKLTPLKVNMSSPIVHLFADIVQSMKRKRSPIAVQEENNGHSAFLPTPKSAEKRMRFSIQISIDDIEVQLLRETESKPMALANPLISFTLTDAAIDYSQGEQITASILIRDSALFDLSCGRGIRVVGEDPEARLEFPYFVRVKLYMHHGPQTVRLHINWGRIQCLLLPSFVRSLLDFKNGLRSLGGGDTNKTKATSAGKKDMFSLFLHHPNDVNLILSADAETFECILASKDIVDYVKKGERDPIGVVTFRWKASLSVALALDCLRDSSMPWLTLNLDGVFTDDEDAILFKDFSNRYLVRGSGSFETANEGLSHDLVNAFTLRLSHRLSSFQALRTNIAKMDLPASHRSFIAIPRVCFKISQPAAGEQRITNPIDFMLLYRAVGASMRRSSSMPTNLDVDVELAQLLQMRSDFVDVLLYIQSKSAGGFTDSYQVSVRPILDMLKKKDSRRAADGNDVSDGVVDHLSLHRLPKLTDILKRAPSICSLQIEGFQVTCVPGGASRLNESPIIKFNLANVVSGIAATPVPQEMSVLPNRRAQGAVNSPQRNYISGSEWMNMTLVGWIRCRITGHYHNRRLVAWEPFIEPWMANARFGIDLVEILRWKPVIKHDTKMARSPADLAVRELDSRETSLSATGKERLRDFGRLFRSPFQQSLQSPDSPRKEAPFLSFPDFCFLMLSSSARRTIISAVYPTGDPPPAIESMLFSTTPECSPLDWLRSFGQPNRSSEPREVDEPYSISVVLSDERPLNINLTGALIENVMGYLDHAKKAGSKSVVPHLIRNDTGMTIRFREVLDVDRAKRGENAARIILGNGSEAPLTLKRSLSQTCDPHRAFIYLEIGNFEDTVGRVNHDDFDIPKGKRSSIFFFKAAAKIPVDAVGVHRYPLDRNVDLRSETQSLSTGSRAVGWIIVRVALRGSVKVVSVESPFVLKSAADADLLCEIRDQTGLSLLWRCLVPKDEGIENHDGIVSIPADIVPFLHDGSYRFSVGALSRSSFHKHEAEIISIRALMTEISTPPPFSSESFGKGLIGEEEIALSMIPPVSSDEQGFESIHLTVCGARIGSVNLSPVDALTEVPEQRMIFFRSPLLIRNFLALPIAVQVRVRSNASLNGPSGNQREPALLRRNVVMSDWEDLGVLDCGESVNWTGSLSSDIVQIRTRFVGVDGDNSRRFPGWSSAVDIPARQAGSRVSRSEGTTVFTTKMKVLDAENAPLSLSVAVEHGNSSGSGEQTDGESIRHFCRNFSSATRIASIFVPFWIVDGTHQDLEFYAGSSVAGQLEGSHSAIGVAVGYHAFGNTLGLAELMDNDQFLDTTSKAEFDVLMVGEDSSNRLTVRKRLARKGRATTKFSVSPWSDPLPLLSGQKTQHDLTVLTPNESVDHPISSGDDPQSFERLCLRSKIVKAPRKFGGHLGTRLIHIVNRYSVGNETGRDIEIDSQSSGVHGVQNCVISATSRPQPFHFDDSRAIRFRFKEYGWTWSGYFNVRSTRREVTMRIRHKMKGQTLIVTVELRSTKQSATSLLVFRQTNYPPFRLENHTMHPLRFGQSLSVLGQEENECDSMLLQYQNADFAWDEPELRRRTLIVKSSGSTGFVEDMVLGRFLLDKIAPGTAIKLDNDIFTAEIVADGPTRVLRISDASMPRISSFRQDEFDYFKHAPDVSKTATISLVAKISHGIGISVVDFSPKELLYVRLEDIHIEKKTDTKKDDVAFSIGCIKLNNQLWVTPYPVLLRMGRQYDARMYNARRKNRRHDAVCVSWRSSLNTHGGYGNVTLLDSVDVSSEPVFVNVDGELASALYRMARHVADVRSHGKEARTGQSRDEELTSLLAISVGSEANDETSEAPRVGPSLQDESGMDSATTAASAAKLRSNPEYQQTFSTPRLGRYSGRNTTRKLKRQPSSKVQHKFYVERLRISATRADLSWSGPLPGLVSSLLFKALTFERLPVRLRPYSSSHAYGNLQDHMQLLRSHYLSFWRIADVLVGLSSNPTFLFRAVIYTLRETCASIMDASAFAIQESSTKMTRFVSRDSELQPIYYDETSVEDGSEKRMGTKKAIVPFVNGTVIVLNKFSSAITWLSSHLKYGNKGGSAQRTRGLVRSRNPRLFAHVDGKDLLVEYVEGENAGKALLSRVRMGLHLGEGYFFHVEGARQRRTHSKVRTELDPSPLIFMITSERVLLLTGRLDRDFCSVEWESFFLNIVHVAVVPADELSTFTYDEVIIWHLCDPEFSAGNQVQTDSGNVFATNLVSGIDVLHCQSIFVPRLVGKQLLQKMHSVDNRLGH